MTNQRRARPGEHFLSGVAFGKTALEFNANRAIVHQGEPASSVFYLREGMVKISAVSGGDPEDTSAHKKEVIVALAHGGEFFGLESLCGLLERRETVTALTDCKVEKIESPAMGTLLRDQPAVRDALIEFLIVRNARYEQDLVDQIFSDSERRLARILLHLADADRENSAEPVVRGIGQADLAQMIGTTRPRVSHFMSEFRKHGLVEYDRGGQLTIHRERISAALRQRKPFVKRGPRPASAMHACRKDGLP